MLSLYHQARSPVHALPTGIKLLVLVAVGTWVFFVRSTAVLGIALGVVAACYAVARIPWRLAVRQLFGVLPFAAIVMASQLLIVGWVAAVLLGERILLLVALANLVTLTTRTSAMIAAVEAVLRPLSVFGVRPARIGLVVAVTIRFIPVVREQADQVRAAQRARGVERSLAFLTPLLIKTLRLADSLGEALESRGVEAAERTAGRPGDRGP